MDAQEVVRRALQIEKLTSERSYRDVAALLRDLDTSRVTPEQLETTDIVRVLYRLQKTCTDGGVRRQVKGLLSKWKKDYSRVKGAEPEVEKRAEREASGDKDHPQTLSSSSSSSSSSVRDKCTQLLLAALRPQPPDREEAARLAADIERHIHQLHAANQVKYKTCVRSKVANLRNPKNSHLRQGLLCGSLAAQAFARMSAEEMAGAELRRLREAYSSRGVSERQLPQGVEGTPTRRIRCEKCGGRECRVTQVNRGVLFLPAWVRQGGKDEDAMTFVTCSGCGQQWYHSGWVCL